MKSGYEHIAGKTIQSVFVAENDRTPKRQVFLVFNDGSYFEFYGDQFNCASAVDKGDVKSVISYISKMGATIKSAQS